MAFRPEKYNPSTDVKRAVIANSQTITVGDAIVAGATSHAGAVSPATNTSAYILGVVVSIEGPNGQILEKNSVTAASNNETVGLIQAVYIPSNLPIQYEADLSAAAGTTNYSALPCFLTIGSGTAGTLDETTTQALSTTSDSTVRHFTSYGVTSYSTTKVRGHFFKFV